MAYRVTNALAWGYDWLYDQLSDDERRLVRDALHERTRDIAEHAILNAKIHLFPYDSHAVRSVSLTLVPACIALLGEDEGENGSGEARDWLNYCIEFLATVYSPWGDADGGWAEGTNYWMMGMAYLIEAANRLKSFAGIDLYQRPSSATPATSRSIARRRTPAAPPSATTAPRAICPASRPASTCGNTPASPAMAPINGTMRSWPG